ncbi:MAG: threonylcarbamoyl-AMP synthase [Actinobacteria bacterium]|nr:threonylcarbamoyl-AMP synthase [Actinomycetota bacterium]
MNEQLFAALRNGDVVVIPTDTVYGLACLPRLHEAVEKVFALKGRPDDKPLPVLGDGIGTLETVATFDDRAVELARRFWPGPLTLVLPRAAAFRHDLGGDDHATVAVRVPQNEVALELLSHIGPLATTSANRSGEAPATSAAEAKAIFGDHVAGYLDGGPCRGLPSTVLSLVGPPRVLREGALAATEVLAS